MKRKQYIMICMTLTMAAAQASAVLASQTRSYSSIVSGLSTLSDKDTGAADAEPSGADSFGADSSGAKSSSGADSSDAGPSGASASPSAGKSEIVGLSEEEIRNLLTPVPGGISSVLEESEEETEAETEAETETETETENGTVDDAEEQTEPEAVPSSAPVIGEEESGGTPIADPSQSAHSLFDTPDISDYNAARISLYDYRMLCDYPLSSLPRDLHTLYYTIKDMTSGYDGTWSVYVEDLSTRQAMIVGDQYMKSASTMKLFIMAAVYDQIDTSRIERTDEIVSLLHDMISNSSNEAANRLLLKLGDGDYASGVEAVDRYISSHGYSSETHEYNGFEDSAAIVDGSHFNQITAKDIGLLLERIYSRNFISRKVCNEIENMMLNQATRYKIPKGLPEGVEVANKTGEMDTVENDAAVVYGEKTDFILVVLSQDWDSKDTAMEEIQQIAGTVYGYLN